MQRILVTWHAGNASPAQLGHDNVNILRQEQGLLLHHALHIGAREGHLQLPEIALNAVELLLQQERRPAAWQEVASPCM